MAVASQKLYNPCVLGVNHLHKLVHGHSSFVVQLASVLIQRVQTRPVSLIVTDWFEESHLNPPSFRVILASIGLKHLCCKFQDFIWGLKNLNNDKTPRKLIQKSGNCIQLNIHHMGAHCLIPAFSRRWRIRTEGRGLPRPGNLGRMEPRSFKYIF